MSKFLLVLIPVLALYWNVVPSSQQHLVCKNIEDVFTDDGLAETRPSHRGIQGPPGKMGSKGERGIRGLPGTEGSPGRVDYDRVDDVIDDKITNSMSVMNSTISELKRNLSTLLSEWEELKPIFTVMKRKEEEAAAAQAADCRRREGLPYSGKCFTLPQMSSSRDMTYDQAVAECARHGALLADIHDRDQQTALYDFALTKMPAGSSLVYVWLGMEYKLSTSTLLYRSGLEKHSNQFQWYPGYPTSSSSENNMGMCIRNDDSSNFGLFNYVKAGQLHGVMCEKET